MIQWFIELSAWWSSLSSAAQFFFLTPFLVAVVGLAADRPERPHAAPAGRGTHERRRATSGWRRAMNGWRRDTIGG